MRRRSFKTTSGTILRLIDVVFLLLFGFISISQLNQRSLIRLPRSSEVMASVPDREEVVFIGILPDGTFLVDQETATLTTPERLQLYLQQKRDELARRRLHMRVRIRANWDVPMRHVFRAVASCQKAQLAAGLEVIRTSAN